jgi:hypothetical protein
MQRIGRISYLLKKTNMRIFLNIIVLFSLSSCWTKIGPGNSGLYGGQLVMGYKPIYGEEVLSKKIVYSSTPIPVVEPGNIYAKGNLIYQVEVGKGMHVIDNSVSSQAHRIGFITVNGCSQISVKGDFLYTNSYDDLVVIDMTNVNNITEVKRVRGAFPEGRTNYFYIQPPGPGYYECPRYDSMVIGWRRDSVYTYCFKN